MVLMRNHFKSLFTLCVFGLSIIFSTFSAEAINEISFDLTAKEIQIEESEILIDDTAISSEFIPNISYAFNENTFQFYDQLDDNNKAAYDAMKIWTEPTTEEFKISFPDAISFQTESTDISQWDEEQYNNFWYIIFSNILYGKDALLFDYPEIFWLDVSQIQITLSNVRTSKNIFTGIYTMKISEIKLKGNVKEEYTDTDTAKEFKQILDDAVNSFEIQGTDRYQQVKYIHDYIANTVIYNMTAPYHDASIGLFCEPYQLVCEGYSKSLKILCDKADIPCIVVPGNIDVETHTGHMWNYIMMEDNEWYGLDCTWNDLDSTSNPIKYTYFLKGSNSFNINHTPDTEDSTITFTYPELNTDDYIYTTSAPTTTVLPTTTVAITSTELESTTVSMPITETTTVTTTTTLPITTTNVQSDHLEGDFNIDSSINAADLVVLRKVLLKIEPMDSNFPNDDLNSDNVINVFDYIILSRRILGGV